MEILGGWCNHRGRLVLDVFIAFSAYHLSAACPFVKNIEVF